MNVKVLKAHERQYFNSRYAFSVDGDVIHVKVNDFARVTSHKLTDSINLTTNLRRLRISPLAIDMWVNVFKDKHTLIDVQNAINYLKVSSQKITEDTVDNALNVIEKKDAERRI